MTTAHGRIPQDTLAVRVKIARDEAGLSQREAALKCGLTFGEWQGIENGAAARGLDKKIDKIARGLDYDRDWLMWGGPLATDGDDGSRPIRRYVGRRVPGIGTNRAA
jgi:transcriptional regulator with XRE-family HTH domain